MNRLKKIFFLVMIIIGLLALSFNLANAQTIRYWTACAVFHEDGSQCFEEVVINLDSLEWESRLVDFDTSAWIKYGWITDFITWVATDTTFEGNCEHDWVLDVEKLGSIGIHFIGFEIMDCTGLNPDGKHCNEHQSATREKICRKCLFSVIESEKWFQRFVAPPKSEFEILKEKQRAKQ